MHKLIRAWLWACVSLPAGTLSGQQEGSDVNVPYAHYFGTGTYVIDGVRTWVLSVRAAPALSGVAQSKRVGFALRLGASVASQGLESDSSSPTIPFFAFVPGVEVLLLLDDRILLRPFLDVGVARRTQSNELTALTSLGATAEFVFPAGRFEFALEPRVLYSATTDRDAFFQDVLFLTSLSADVRHRLWFTMSGNQVDLGLYVSTGQYWGDADLRTGGEEFVELRRELEVGLSFWTEPANAALVVSIPPALGRISLQQHVEGLQNRIRRSHTSPASAVTGRPIE